MFALSVDNRYRNTREQPQRDKAIFAISEPIILEREGGSFKHPRRIDEIETVYLQVANALRFGPDESYLRIVYTLSSDRKIGP